jgi:predicted O-linked N-acetylglucosamine transferase (SPINDLY family)
MAELFEQHDKSRFELTAFSFGPDKQDAMRGRVSAAFEKFIDVRSVSDVDVAMQARSLGLDIALDLKGFCQDSRTGIFALRAAPVQVNYLGYPGTMGAEYIDYLIADATLIPEEHQRHYSEKIVYLPHCYQANDTKRPISDKAVTRQGMGLPQAGFVFCCFNNNFKIVPGVFDCWMRILKQVEGSVLWLLEDNAKAADNLRREAEARGVNRARLVFARRLPLPEHLARHRLADLFLDTLPCNAHTTASDALWAGLPVLTSIGETFAGRVAASLLSGVLLPELAARTLEDYERLAVDLATNPGRLAEVRHRLAGNRLTAPLFDIQLFTRHIEAAYVAMFERYRANLPPAHIHVQAGSRPGEFRN